jgi:hypothetical protein
VGIATHAMANDNVRQLAAKNILLELGFNTIFDSISRKANH